MLEVLVCNNKEEVEKLYKSSDITMPENGLAVRAICGKEMLGFSLFEIKENSITVLFLTPENDRLLADGILRSTLHVGTERGVTKAFYGEKISEELLAKINFLEDREERLLKLQNLFTDCCNCTSKEKG